MARAVHACLAGHFSHTCVHHALFLQNNDNFEEGLLKLVRTLPKVLKFLPSDKAQDARNFVQSLQYWLGGNADNLENLLISTAQVGHFRPMARNTIRWLTVKCSSCSS